MNCPNCKTDNPSSANYCIDCGAPLFKKCDFCETTTILSAKFCPNCGKAFQEDDVNIIKYKNKLSFHDYIFIYKQKSGKYIVAWDNQRFILLDITTLKPIFDLKFEEHGEQQDYFDFNFFKKDGKWGILNPVLKKKVTDFIYEDYHNHSHISTVFSVLKDGFWGKVDAKTGLTTVPHIYDKMEYDDRVKYRGYWGWLGDNGHTLTVPCEYRKLSDYSDWRNIRPSQHKNGKWGVIDRTGKILLNFEYDEIKYTEPFGNSLYYLRKGDKWGLYYYEATLYPQVYVKEYPCIYQEHEVVKLKYR